MPTPGPLELVIILVIALLILGPGKLPDVGSALGKSIREFRKASSDVQDAVKLDTPPTTADQAPAAGPAAAPVVPAATVATAAEQPPVASTSSATAPSSEPTPGTN